MYDVAIEAKDSSEIPRWMAFGFWYADTFIRSHTSHPGFRGPAVECRERAYELISNLAYLLFMGESPYRDDTLRRLAKG